MNRFSPRNPANRRRVGVAALAALSGVLALLWPAAQSFGGPDSPVASLIQPVDPPTGPVEVINVDAPITWSDSTVTSVTVDVRNASSEPVDADVWWLLAAPGDARPWVDPASRGKVQRVRLEPGEIAAVVVPTGGKPRPGAWTLSLWAHTVNDDRTTPSHGTNVTPSVHVLPTHPDVFRLTDPGEHAALTVVEPVGRLLGSEVDGGPDALVSVRAITQQPVHLELRCYLSPPGVAEPWRHDDTIGSYVEEVSVEVGEPQAATCRFPEVPDGGEWELSAFIRRVGGAAAKTHEDGLYARRALLFGDDRNVAERSTDRDAGARTPT